MAILCFQVHSQDKPDESSLNLNGSIVDEETLEKLFLVHIYNESTRKTVVSDTGGNFTATVNRGDALVFSCIGYFYKVVHITDSMLSEGSATIKMASRKYEVPEARVIGLGTYEQFKQKVLSLKLPKTQTDVLRESLQKICREVAQEVEYNRKMDQLTQGGNLLSVPILTPEEIEMLKLKVILEKEKIQKVIAEKYNRNIVGELTGLKHDELTEFMVFCNFSEEFLLESNQYDILIKVLEKLEEFKKKKFSGFNADIDIFKLC